MMLTVVPDAAPAAAWIQVLGRVGIQDPVGEPHRLTGSGQRLLAVFVAAGIEGATAERIAEEIWGDSQPNPWRPALRMAVTRLRKQLPTDWDIIADGGFYRIHVPPGGWVDAWRLADFAATPEPVVESDLVWMLAGQPFGDTDLLEMVNASTQNLQMLQVAVAERFCAQRATSISTTTCSVLSSLLRDHPYNDRLALVIGNALAFASRRTEAIMAVASFAETYAAEFDDVPGDIADFLSPDHVDAPARPSNLVSPVSSQPELLAKELRHFAGTPFFGRDELLTRLRTSGGALLVGPRGAGKSRLLAALISGDARTETTYVVGDPQFELPLGSFAVAMPALRDRFLGLHDEAAVGPESPVIERSIATLAWRIALAHLETRSAYCPQRLVVDDADQLDPASLGLVRLLIRSNTNADITIVVAGRSDSDEAIWNELMHDAERAGLERIEVDGLDVATLEAMVFDHFPDATHAARHGLAIDVWEASEGLPAIAAPLIAAADPDTLGLPDRLAGVSTLGRVASSTSDRAPEVVAAAAVLGHQFSIGTLIALSDLDESTVFAVLDDLWSKGLIVETDDPDQVRFRHVLVQRASLEGVPMFRRCQLHRRAAELTSDVHEIAKHHARAETLIEPSVARASLAASARRYVERKMWRQAATEFQRMSDLVGEALDASELALWATAKDLVGTDGSDQRRQAFELAAAAEDWSTAALAALSGLPNTEQTDGDPDRVEMLLAISEDQLPVAIQFERAYNLSRQYSLLGEFNEMLRFADRALELAHGPDEAGITHLLRWMATRHGEPQAYRIPAEALADASPRVHMRIAQMTTVNLAEAGDFAGAAAENDRFRTLATEVGEPLRIWHSMGIDTMFLLNDCKFGEADELELARLKYAELHSLGSGVVTYLGHRVYSFDMQDQLGVLHAELLPFRNDLESLSLGRGALILCEHAAGATDIGPGVRSVLNDVQQRSHSPFSRLAMVMMARLVRRYAPEQAALVRRELEKFGDKPLLANFGGASFGPTVRYLAYLTDDIVHRRELIERSILAADRQGPLLWRVRTRLHAADLGDELALDQAASLAAGTDMEAVVARRAALLR